jgi:hypothetical protein
MRIRSLPILASALMIAAAACAAPYADTKEFVEQAKANLTHDFKDPQSAQFRDLFLSEYRGLTFLCGDVNGKNGYGAYIGFLKFYAARTSGLVGVANPASPTFDMINERVHTRCGNKVADVK